MTIRESITETVSKLFVYTDEQQWESLQEEVFTENVFLDMTSLGGEAAQTTAKEICTMWEAGFKDLDAVNHLAGNYLIDLVLDDEAEVFAYATATHYKADTTQGPTREFVGTYSLKLKRLEAGWRIYSLVYNLKYMTGNLELR